jgi:drug/metabolite transporter (DMT)-like permease
MMPVFSAILSHLIRVDTLTLFSVVGLAVAIIGAIYVIDPFAADLETSGSVMFGNLIVIVNAAFMAVWYSLSPIHMRRGFGPVTLNTFAVVFSLALSALVVLATDGFAGFAEAANYTTRDWLLIVLVMGFGGSSYVKLLGIMAVQLLQSPTIPASYACLQPVITALMSWLILGTLPTLRSALGGVIVLAGLVVLTVAKIRADSARNQAHSPAHAEGKA